MTYLILSNYDGGTNWSIKSSLGNLSKEDNIEKFPPLLKAICSYMWDNEFRAFEYELKDALDSISPNFDFVMLCEDGNIRVIKDNYKFLGDK